MNARRAVDVLPETNVRAFAMKFVLTAPAVAIGVFLVWWLTGDLNARIDANTVALGIMKENMALHALDSTYLMKQLDRIASITRAMCVNAAEGVTEQARCVE